MSGKSRTRPPARPSGRSRRGPANPGTVMLRTPPSARARRGADRRAGPGTSATRLGLHRRRPAWRRPASAHQVPSLRATATDHMGPMVSGCSCGGSPTRQEESSSITKRSPRQSIVRATWSRLPGGSARRGDVRAEASQSRSWPRSRSRCSFGHGCGHGNGYGAGLGDRGATDQRASDRLIAASQHAEGVRGEPPLLRKGLALLVA
jgi:hypothetical protein